MEVTIHFQPLKMIEDSIRIPIAQGRIMQRQQMKTHESSRAYKKCRENKQKWFTGETVMDIPYIMVVVKTTESNPR
jgi:hypothetical protein